LILEGTENVKEITSNANKNYKLCVQLATRKYRDKYGLYLIEGSKLIEEAMLCNVEIKVLFLRENYESDYGAFGNTDGASAADGIPAADGASILEVSVLKKNLFDVIAQTETSQGIIAIVEKRKYGAEEFFDKCNSGNILVLDRLQDPGNIGTLIRTADAAGYKGVICLKGTGDVFSPKVVRAAAGSLFRMPILFVDTAEEVLELVKSRGKKIVSTCFDADVDYFDVDLKTNIALLIGNEGQGLSERLITGADVKVKIPMSPSVDSLNAAVAGGILMYESLR